MAERQLFHTAALGEGEWGREREVTATGGAV